MTKKYFFIILCLILIVGLTLEFRFSYYTMKPVDMNAAEIGEEMPDILSSSEDLAMEERLLNDPSFHAKIASVPVDDQTFTEYPLSNAVVLLDAWLKDGWELKELAYNAHTITISATMNESQNLIYLFSTDGSFGSQKSIGVYDDEQPYRNCLAIYSNNDGVLEKQVRTRVWF